MRPFSMKNATVLFALAVSVLPLSAQDGEPDFAVSPVNLELGMRSVVLSPTVNPAFGINMEFGLNPGWFINRWLGLGVFFAYAHYFGTSHAESFLSAASAAYTPIEYIYPGPETTIDKMFEGVIEDLSDHRWGVTVRLPIRYSPFIKLYWLSRAVLVVAGSSGSYTSGGVTYVGTGTAGYGFVCQGAGVELAAPLRTFEWGKWNALQFTRVSLFAQYVNLRYAYFDAPRPYFSEMFDEAFNDAYGDIVEIGLSVSLGF